MSRDYKEIRIFVIRIDREGCEIERKLAKFMIIMLVIKSHFHFMTSESLPARGFGAWVF
jgi:hypothetical protein